MAGSLRHLVYVFDVTGDLREAKKELIATVMLSFCDKINLSCLFIFLSKKVEIHVQACPAVFDNEDDDGYENKRSFSSWMKYRKLPVDGYVVWWIVDDFDDNIITFVHFYRRARQLPVHRNNAGAAA